MGKSGYTCGTLGAPREIRFLTYPPSNPVTEMSGWNLTIPNSSLLGYDYIRMEVGFQMWWKGDPGGSGYQTVWTWQDTAYTNPMFIEK